LVRRESFDAAINGGMVSRVLAPAHIITVASPSYIRDGRPPIRQDSPRFEHYPALRRVGRSCFAAFLEAGFLPSMGMSISFWPDAALRRLLVFGGALAAGNAHFESSMRSTTFSPLGRGLALMVLPLRLALMGQSLLGRNQNRVPGRERRA
jgi:hypothetical protein